MLQMLFPLYKWPKTWRYTNMSEEKLLLKKGVTCKGRKCHTIVVCDCLVKWIRGPNWTVSNKMCQNYCTTILCNFLYDHNNYYDHCLPFQFSYSYCLRRLHSMNLLASNLCLLLLCSDNFSSKEFALWRAKAFPWRVVHVEQEFIVLGSNKSPL